ncbi:MAG: hypothetical protein ACI8RZ_004195, partial [Myxococcota bacterium]
TSDANAARALLADPALIAPLLELMDQPGEVRVLPDGVRLSLPGWPTDDLGMLLKSAVEVAVCLAEPPKSRQRQGLKTT